MIKKEWIETDDDSCQQKKYLGGRRFRLIECRDFTKVGYGCIVCETTIDLEFYSIEEINEYVKSYYMTLDNLEDIYGDESDEIIAECIFEEMQVAEMNSNVRFKTVKEARKFIKKWIDEN